MVQEGLSTRRNPPALKALARIAAGVAGFSLVELVAVILLLGVLAAVALPRFLSLSSSARVAALESLAGSMQTTVALTRAQARLQGLVPAGSNPGAGQTAYIIETELGRSEVDWRNLCPESSAEMADALDMADFMTLSLAEGMTMSVNNQYTRIGYTLSSNTTSGCYVVYDSFGDPDCTITVVSVDC